jgi:hypothetical protein
MGFGLVGMVDFYWDRGRPRPHVALEVICEKNVRVSLPSAGEGTGGPI